MPVDPRILELVVRYEELREAGHAPALEDLCRDWPEGLPELRRRLGDMQALAPMLASEDASTAATLSDPRVEAVPPTAHPSARYFPLRFHARGGLGEVVVARDTELGREVALKRIRPERRADSESRRRFVIEAETTARLEHPGIVSVHGLVCEEDGSPSYAMRFVEGETLADAIAKAHQSPGGSAEWRKALRRLLTSFVAVCNTLAYAHKSGVIHRDIKPANIMLGEFGETLVVDWGLAKTLGEDGHQAASSAGGSDESATRIGQTLGTPAYMSPEQAEGRWDCVGPTSDVYSLGATLYQILIGRPPFEGEVDSVLERVKRGDFPRPRAVDRNVPQALEAICLKAMAHSPAARYPLAKDLVEEVDLWLADEPVRAWREPVWMRARRVLSRHRTLATGAMTALLAVLLSGAAANVPLTWAKRDAERQAQRAEQNFQLAWEAVDEFTTEVSEHTLLNQPGLQPLRKELLRTALTFYGRLAEERRDDPRLEEELALAYARAARVEHLLGQETAESTYKEAIHRQERLAAAHPGDGRFVAALAGTWRHLGSFYRGRKQSEQARASLDEALRLAGVLQEKDEPRGRRELAEGLASLGLLQTELKQFDDGHTSLRQALAHLEKQPEDVSDRRSRRDLAQVYNSLGFNREQAGKFREAVPWFEQARDLQETRLREQADNISLRSELGRSRYNLGVAFHKDQQAERAIEAYRHAWPVLEQVALDNPAVPEYHQRLGDCCSNLALLLRDRGQWTEAVRASTKAVEIRAGLSRANSASEPFRGAEAQSCNLLAVWHSDLGDREEAVRLHRRVCDLRTSLWQARPKDGERRALLADALHNLGEAERDRHRLKEALTLFHQAEEIQQRLAADKPGDGEVRQSLARTWHNTGALLTEIGRVAEGRALLMKALEARRSAENSPNPRRRRQRAQTYVALGVLEREAGDLVAAVMHLQKACTLQADLARHSPDLVDPRIGLMLALAELGRAEAQRGEHAAAQTTHDRAVHEYEKALALAPELKGARRYLGGYYASLAGLERDLRQPGKAAATARTRKLLWPHDPTDLLRGARDLALCVPLVAMGKAELLPTEQAERQRYADEALDALREAITNGFVDVSLLRDDPGLAALGAREEFPRLLRRLEDKTANKRQLGD